MTPNELNENINKWIDKALQEEREGQPPRGYLGGSALGGECGRALYYDYKAVPRDEDKEFSGRTLRRFKLGHMHEAETATWLRNAGFDLATHDEYGEQFGFSVAGGAIQGHVDGLIRSSRLPKAVLSCPALWEHKIMREDKWKKYQKDGIKKANYVYYAQCQIYMAYISETYGIDINQALFTGLNSNTSELHFEIINFEVAAVQRLSDRGVNIIRATSPDEVPKISRDSTDYRCKLCSWQKTCWGSIA